MTDISTRLAQRLAELRHAQSLSLEQLAAKSGVSRAALSRLENGTVSPTAETLGKLCTAFGLPLSRLMMQVEQGFSPLISAAQQPVWQDPATGFIRRQMSPPDASLTGEMLHCTLPAQQVISYEAPPRPGLEHHLWLQTGELTLGLGPQSYVLTPGDCLRYHLTGPSLFSAGDSGASYILVIL